MISSISTNALLPESLPLVGAHVKANSGYVLEPHVPGTGKQWNELCSVDCGFLPMRGVRVHHIAERNTEHRPLHPVSYG